MNATRLLNAPMDRWLRKVQADEEAWVADHRRARKLVLRTYLWMALVLAAIVVRVWLAPGSWYDAAAGLFLGGWAGTGATTTVRRGLGYRSGWLKGRSALVASLGEAHRRGMDANDWLSLELARDYGVLGLPPPPGPQPGGE